METSDGATSPDAESQWREMVRGLLDGDEQVYAQFWELYGERLRGIARHHLPSGLQHRVAPEDLVQSVCRTFYRRVTEGKLQLTDSESLWRLLCAVTLNKARMHVRFQLRQRRSPNREVHYDQLSDTDAGASLEPADAQITPDEAVVFADQLQTIMSDLDDEEREFLQLRLQGFTHAEIAQRLECSERTVRRILSRLRSRWQSRLEETLSNSE